MDTQRGRGSAQVRFQGQYTQQTTQQGTLTIQTRSEITSVVSSLLEMMKTESVSLHPLGTAAAPEPELLCILGTGDLGRSLGLRLLQSGYRVVYGSRRPHSCGPLPQGAQVTSHAAAAQSASLIFICVHREHYGFLETIAHHLEGKVLVDLSNNLKKEMYPEANAAYLQRLVPGAAVVKGLNTLSAWALQNGLLAGKQVYLCGNSEEAKWAVAEMSTKLGLSVLDKGSLSAARELEDFPLELFPEWRLPLRVAVGLAAFFFFYLLIRDVIYAYVEEGKDISFRITVSLGNKMKNNKSALSSFDNTKAWGQDSFYALGILGFFLYVLLGLTSLPSVGGSLSWREFNFIQSKLGHLTLFICTTHGYIYGWNKFLQPSTYKWYTPPGYLLCLIVPSVVLVLKALVLLPCVDRTLTRIRQGWERTQPNEEIEKVTNCDL
ncbi:metalloreductase STEAP4-like isoform X3 [Pungitius pungitius]|uniref:metalloreductase STEAP4-like isoform X3 n=1 Tax=Pungitius pungitius TaxID=134920 RepID=UPI00188830D5|nr:metalloreductase STEAP4-like isoform X3 [Pungitius pungitius]